MPVSVLEDMPLGIIKKWNIKLQGLSFTDDASCRIHALVPFIKMKNMWKMCSRWRMSVVF